MKTILSVTLVLFAVGVLAITREQSTPSTTLSRTDSVTATVWDKPAMATPQVIEITDTTRNLNLSPSVDYVLKCDNTGTLTYGLVVYGGHNVVLEDCTYDVGSVFVGAAQFKNQTGTLWLHDVHFKGSNLEEGIDLQEPNPAVRVVFRDVLVDPVYSEPNADPTKSPNHADVIQSWCGPAVLAVDGLSGQTNYQGILFLPNQNGNCSTTTPQIVDLRHVDIKGIKAFNRDSATMLWAGWYGSNAAANVTLNIDHVYVQDSLGGAQFWPNSRQWVDVTSGTPPDGPFVIPASWGATGPRESCLGAGCSNQQGAYGAGEDPAPIPGE